MRKLIAAINITIDGYCDHDAVVADAELHNHFKNVLEEAGVILYGRKTFQLMEYWKEILEHPTGKKDEEELAVVMDKVPKIVFSNTLKTIGWHSAVLSELSPEEEVARLKSAPGKDIYIGSPGLIAHFSQQNMVDVFRLVVHPNVAGKGRRLFPEMQERINLRLIKSKVFASGAVAADYEVARQ